MMVQHAFIVDPSLKYPGHRPYGLHWALSYMDLYYLYKGHTKI